MSDKCIVSKSELKKIADKIREKDKSTTPMKVGEMADRVSEIPSGIEVGGSFIVGAEPIGYVNCYWPKDAKSIASVHIFGNIRSADIDVIEEIKTSCFANITTLTYASFGGAVKVSEGAFLNCKKVATILLPKATSIGASAFGACYALESIDLSSVTKETVESNKSDWFYNCKSGQLIRVKTSDYPDGFNLTID